MESADCPDEQDSAVNNDDSDGLTATLQPLVHGVPQLNGVLDGAIQSALAAIQGELASGKHIQSALASFQADLASGRHTQSALARAQEDIASGSFAAQPLGKWTIKSSQFAASFAVSREEQPSSYSISMTSPASYFAHTEGRIESLAQLNVAVAQIAEKNPELRFVWRGARDANWGLHSGLFLALMKFNRVTSPGREAKGPQPYPDERQMVEAEATMLEIARTEWRMDDAGPLEILARMQHYGAPTRLIDITKNPYIAAWFATESHSESDERDGRLFAIATSATPLRAGESLSESRTRASDLTASNQPVWHGFTTPQDRESFEWGTGSRRRIWVPPAYDPRIVAQNAGFMLDGVPLTSKAIAPYFKVNSTSTYWTRADILASGSIYAKMSKPRRAVPRNKANLAATFSWRITASAKAEVRDALETMFGYTRATIYPDISALGSYLRDRFATYAPGLEGQKT
ncbi:FRG domain-containing protein [Cryobacterium sp. MDB2-33-2]|uniref:FRG domain-containing protein n=1 Tax=Cryobacterium sp. MDB2-33-2 TaxID=1259179 RepID=UPI00106AD177|nr:FRG domain-containing protein [Cryobacterium sp. MDB2-33-2]TFC11087.1 FRG domain-containing protein [Cryobacterium sp. MDB2-33-2]